MKTIILGAGFAGLAAGVKTGAPIYEAGDHAGGICRSYMKEGFEFSVGGGHWFFGGGKGLEYIKSICKLKKYDKKASVYFNNKITYPFQTFAEKDNESRQGSMKRWLAERFSNDSCNMFFYPFNEKYTCGLYDEVIQYDAYKTPPKGSTGFVSHFWYPDGGLNEIVDEMGKRTQINYGYKAVGIDIRNKVVKFENGEEIGYDRIISTIPLDKMVEMCGFFSTKLLYTSVFVLNIGAKPAENTPDDHWIYVPFCNSGFYRLGFYSNVEKRMAPDGYISLSAEYAFIDDIDINRKTDEIIAELKNWRFIGDVKVKDPTIVKCAYTWLTHDFQPEYLIQYLKDNNIISIGRYGKWKFQGMLQSIEDGLEVEC